MSKETEKLFNGITNIEEELIEDAQKEYGRTKKPLRFLPWAGAAAAVCVCAAAAGIFVLNSGTAGVPVDNCDKESTAITSETPAATADTEMSIVPATIITDIVLTTPPETSFSELPAHADESTGISTEDTVDTTATETAFTSQTTVSSETTAPVTTVSTTETTTPEITETAPAEETIVTTSETTAVTEKKIPQTSVNDLTYLSAPDDAASVLTEPVYPYIPPYPDESVYTDYDEFDAAYEAWSKAKYDLRRQPGGYTNGTESFFRNSIKVFLGDESTENKVYSPLSLFMALGMSAEISGGYTRQQFLDVLGQDSIEDLRSHANSIWQANFSDDGAAKCILASSVWLNNDISYAQETVGNISDFYYSSVYSGIPGTEEYDKLLQNWLNSQTDGMLDEYASDVQLDPSTVIALASTVNYSGKWNEKFSKELTKKRSFKTPGGYIGCDFMNAKKDTLVAYSDKFTAISMSLEENGSMRLILPDEGVSPEELLSDKDAVDYMMLKSIKDFRNTKFMTVNLSLPKFDVSQQTDLTEGMKALGITDAFDSSVSDFEPLTDTGIDISIGSATQASRVMIDEDGCKAASFTILSYDGDLDVGELDEIDLIFERPFIFEIMSESGLPLFVGIVNNPVE